MSSYMVEALWLEPHDVIDFNEQTFEVLDVSPRETKDSIAEVDITLIDEEGYKRVLSIEASQKISVLDLDYA